MIHLWNEFLAVAVANPQWILAILVTVILAGPFLAERFRLPGLIGLILGGMLMGPYGLGWLREGSLNTLGGIGLLYLMFLAGAELDLKLLQRYRNAAISFGLLTFILPFLTGLLASTFLGFTWIASILMGTVWASHTLVAYPVAHAAGLTGNRAVATVVGATVITDTLALLILAVISGTSGEASYSSSPLMSVGSILLQLGLLVLYCLVLIPWLARRLFAGPVQDRMTRFIFMFGAMVSAGFVAELGGIEGLVGAFFVGLGLNRLLPNHGQLMEHVEFFGSALFIPAFLVSVGMLINPAVLFNWQTIQYFLFFAVALLIGKSLAAMITGRIFRFSRAETTIMFPLTIAQAAATLATTLVGFRLGFFGEEVVNAVLLVVLTSLVISTLGTRWIAGRIEPEKIDSRSIGESVFILVQPSTHLQQIVEIGVNIAHPDAGTVTPVAIIPEFQGEKTQEETKTWLQKANEFGRGAGADVDGVFRIDADIPRGIVREMAERNGSFLLMEWTQSPRIEERIFGNLLDQIGARSHVPQAAVRFSDDPIERIVLVTGRYEKKPGYKIDLAAAIGLALCLSGDRHLPLAVIAQQNVPLEKEQFPKGTDWQYVEPGIQATAAHFRKGDLVIVPEAVIRRFLGLQTSELLRASEHVSVMIAAGPYRLSLASSGAGQELESSLNIVKAT
jgi:Kef-type K+ transport system membrane component KefB